MLLNHFLRPLNFILFISGLLFCAALSGQSITLLDEETQFPIPHALIFNQSMVKSVLSDEKGKATLNKFLDDDVLVIQHPSYHLIQLNRKDIPPDTFIYLNSKEIELNEIVISATQNVERSDEVPRRIAGINSKDVRFYLPQTSADMLEQSDKIFVQKSQQGGGSPMIRGFSANRILLAYDHIRLNNAISRGGNLHNIISVDPNFLERTEIIYGPGTVIYGSDALGGVVHMRSREISLGSDQMKLTGDVTANYASANVEKTIHGDIGASNKNWGWHTSLTISDFEDLKMGSKGPDEYKREWYVESENGLDIKKKNNDNLTQKYSGYQSAHINQKFKIRTSTHSELELFGQYSSTGDIPRYDRLLQENGADPKYAEWYYGPQKWFLGGIRHTSSRKRFLADISNVAVHYQNWKESRIDRKFRDSTLNKRDENVDVYGMTADFTKNLVKNQSLSYGISSYYNLVSSKAESENIYTKEKSALTTRYPDGGSDMWLNGVYMNYKKNWSNQWYVNGGLRYTYQYLKSVYKDAPSIVDNNTLELKTSAITGSIGATYRLKKRSLFRVNLTSGFRAPNVDDVAKLFDPEPGIVTVPNASLKPEYLYSTEFGYQYSDSNNFLFEFNVFYSYLTSAIIRDDYSINGQDSIIYDGEMKKIQSLVNKDFAHIYGLNIGITYSPIKHFNIRVNYTATRGSDSDREPIRHVPPDFSGLHFIYNNKKLKCDLFMKHHSTLLNNELALSEQNKTHLYAVDDNGSPYSPSWSTINFMCQYQFNKIIGIHGGVENITDERYKTYSSGMVASGRNFIIGIKSRF